MVRLPDRAVRRSVGRFAVRWRARASGRNRLVRFSTPHRPRRKRKRRMQSFEPMPFNSGYFMCVKLNGADPEVVARNCSGRLTRASSSSRDWCAWPSLQWLCAISTHSSAICTRRSPRCAPARPRTARGWGLPVGVRESAAESGVSCHPKRRMAHATNETTVSSGNLHPGQVAGLAFTVPPIRCRATTGPGSPRPGLRPWCGPGSQRRRNPRRRPGCRPCIDPTTGAEQSSRFELLRTDIHATLRMEA